MESIEPLTEEQRQPRVVFHIPHASRVIPTDIRSTILLSDSELNAELLRLTDTFTDEIFQVDPSLATSVIATVSRLVVDVERFPVDENEPMSSYGMGAIYLRTSRGEPLRKVDGNQRELLLREYYEPHHKRLTRAVKAALSHWNSCLILDAHSFSSTPLPHETDQRSSRPEICLGSDLFHTPKPLVQNAKRLFEQAGFITELDRPFSGSLVPAEFYRRDSRVISLMIEINRAMYMDETSGIRLASFEILRERLQSVLQVLAKMSDDPENTAE